MTSIQDVDIFLYHHGIYNPFFKSTASLYPIYLSTHGPSTQTLTKLHASEHSIKEKKHKLFEGQPHFPSVVETKDPMQDVVPTKKRVTDTDEIPLEELTAGDECTIFVKYTSTHDCNSTSNVKKYNSLKELKKQLGEWLKIFKYKTSILIQEVTSGPDIDVDILMYSNNDDPRKVKLLNSDEGCCKISIYKNQKTCLRFSKQIQKSLIA